MISRDQAEGLIEVLSALSYVYTGLHNRHLDEPAQVLAAEFALVKRMLLDDGHKVPWELDINSRY